MPFSYGYVRESTVKQEQSGLGREAQIAGIKQYAKGLTVPFGGMFIDSAVSGMVRMTERKAGAELDRVARRGDIVIVTRLDRAFRRTADAMVMVERWNSLGIALHVVNFGGQSMDMMSGIGKFILTVLVAFAELERQYISERTKIAMAARGTKVGAKGRVAGYGFKWERPGGKLIRVPDERQLDLMSSFYEWNMEADMSFEHISQHMNYSLKIKNEWGEKKAGGHWSARTVQNWVMAEMRRRIAESQGDPEAEAELMVDTESYEPSRLILPASS